MRTSKEMLKSTSPYYTCGRCSMFYSDYKQLVEHLYWRHGTESKTCRECGLKQWRYAAHQCNVLPIDETMEDSDDSQYFSEKEEYCCGKVVDAPMIGCDGPECTVQWYHFTCVGIVVPPAGDWFCKDCKIKSKDKVILWMIFVWKISDILCKIY